MNTSGKPRVWFHAKEYGWGWGLPACWQGWAVLLGYIVLLAMGTVVFRPDRQLPFYLAFTGILSVLLIGVCWLKGEKPAWRWGGRTAASEKRSRRGMLVCHVFLGPLLLGFALYVRTHLPPEINGFYGYKTAMSMQTQEVWDEAQRFSANLMVVAALITIAYQGVSLVTMKPLVSFLTSSGVLVVALVSTIPITELHLKKHFDAQGRSITASTAQQPPGREE